MNAYNPYATSYFPNYAGMTQPVVNPSMTYAPLPQREIDKVNGEESAKAFPIGPNSSVILMDQNDPLIWVVVTDASGYKTVKPFTISPYTPEQPVSTNDLKEQLTDISCRLNKLEERINYGESNNDSSWKNKPNDANYKSNGRNGEGGAKPNGGNKPDNSK